MLSLTIRKIVGPALVALCFAGAACAQNSSPPNEKENWDLCVWVAGETGEEITNSFAESQIWSAGVFVGRMITGERLNGWRRGRLEYAFDAMPVFETYGNQHVHGYGFEPVILRWDSALHTSRASPYIELAGGAVSTSANLPPGNTSSFNFTAKGGGGIYLRTRPQQSVDVGFHWSHISNANLGVDNFEFNGVQLSLAYHWYK